MHLTTLLSAIILPAVAVCGPIAAPYASDFGYTFNPLSPVAQPPSSQYHAQDALGQYNYGYSDPNSAKQEVKTADGVVRGSYSYVDANGLVQTVNYLSDVLGFRAVGTNFPNTAGPAPVAAPAAVAYSEATVNAVPAQEVQVVHEPQYAEPQYTSVSPVVPYSFLPYAANYKYYYNWGQQPSVPRTAPVIVSHPVATPAAAPAATLVEAAAPVIAAAPAVTQTQYHAQDEFGQYNFGYSDPNSARTETKTADGVVRGSYNYIDSEGRIQTVHYIADVLGFRVAATNLPVAVQPVVYEAPEVEAARLEHLALYDQIKAERDQLRYDVVAREQELLDTLGYVAPVAAEAAPVEVGALPVEWVREVPQAAAAAVEVPALPVTEIREIPFVTQEPVAPVAYAADPVVVPAPAPTVAVAAPVVSSQYHAQDELGQYNYGYSNPNSAKVETKDADGIVRGSYSYIDANGKLQTVQYISDVFGFRVAATNIPVHVVDAPAPAVVAASPVANAAAAPVVEAYDAATIQEPVVVAETVQPLPVQPIVTPQVAYSYLPYATQYRYLLEPGTHNALVGTAAPEAAATSYSEPAIVPVATATPVVAPVAAAAPTSSQYHAQDDLGQYNYGYSNANSAKVETKSADGVVRGSYSYIDANGLLQRTEYISDALGFRVAGTNIPQSPSEAMMQPQVPYSYLPYAVNHQYYY